MSPREGTLFQPLDWVLLRAPLLPVESYIARTASDMTAGSLAPRDARVCAALAIGSPSLLNALEDASPSDENAPHALRKLQRYLIRMATRPTPYGMFAGVGLIRWGPSTDLSLHPGRPATRTRPDMEWLLALVMELERTPEIRSQLRLVTNSAAFIRAGRVFLAERAPTTSDDRVAPTVSVRATSPVRRALTLARRPIAYHDLAAALTSTPGATTEKVDLLITELWQQTLLITDLRPPLTRADPAGYVRDRLASIPAAQGIAGELDALLVALKSWDVLPLTDATAAWRQLVQQAGRMSAKAAPAHALQVDMALPLTGRAINGAIAHEAARAAELLLRLSRAPQGAPRLDAYRRAFEGRYGVEREVPLLELLDPQFGLGPLATYSHGDGLDARRSAVRHQTLSSLALNAIRDHRLAVELGDDVLARLETWAPSAETAPISLELSLFVAAKSIDALNAGDFKVVVGPNLGATAAGRNLGRFADLLGPEAVDALEQVARAEAPHVGNRLSAELAYLPARLRSTNVAIRPAVRTYEIAIGTHAGADPERVIPLSELVVGVRDARFYLRWRQANADITTFAGHMLNAMNAPPVAQFLDELARDGRAQLSTFDWGAASSFPFLPRVERGRIVLALAQWWIDKTTLGDPSVVRAPAFHDAVQTWRQRWSAPQYVYLAVGDNRLLIDLDDPAHVEQLREELRGAAEGQALLIQEALPGPHDTWLPGPGGRYMTELIVPMTLGPGLEQKSARMTLVTREGTHRMGTLPPEGGNHISETAARLRPPGTDWLFLKLYGPSSLEDELIAGPVRTFGEFAMSAGLTDSWFFVRYTDPDPHLRLRFRGEPDVLLGRLLPQVCSWAGDLIAGDACGRFSFDTYDREVERYGGEQATSTAEAIFAADSAAVAELLWLSRGQLPTIDRTTLAVLTIDDLLSSLGLAEGERLSWYRDLAPLSSDDGREYRERKVVLRRLLGSSAALVSEPGGESVARLLAVRRQALEPCAQQLQDLAGTGALMHAPAWLCRSYVHMHVNRLLGSGSPLEQRALQLLRRAREGLSRAPMK